MSSWGFHSYVPVAKRRVQAAREVEKLKKKGRVVAPVLIEGRKIARSFWGEAWCDNLERYSDYESRLPRGRTYVRNGSVIDLQIERGRVRALVCGSELYKVEIDIAVAAPSRWKAICKDCAGSVGSLVELLQGKLSKNVMERVCRESDGLFPAPREIKMSCSCPDWADMCKHVAAVLYGAGARLDTAPDLLFTLRGVDRAELISTADADLRMTRAGAASERVLAGDDVAALFGIDMAPPPVLPKAKEGKAKVRSNGKVAAQAAKPAGRRQNEKAEHSVSRDMKKLSEKSAKQAPRPDVTMAARKEKPPAGTRSSNASGKAAALKDTAPAAKKAPEETPQPKGSKPRRPGAAPAGRARVAKWTGARARKTGG